MGVGLPGRVVVAALAGRDGVGMLLAGSRALRLEEVPLLAVSADTGWKISL